MKTIALLYGGRSGEHEVSCCSAASVYDALDRSKYNVIAVAVDKDGKWYPQKNAEFKTAEGFGRVLDIKRDGLWFVNHFPENDKLVIRNIKTGEEKIADAVFPVMHGTYCEDGTLQGLLDLAGVPYVGSGVLGSSVGMDKDFAKKILDESGIPVVPWITVVPSDLETSYDFLVEELEMELGYPCFVKPANAGSSVGITKVKNESELKPALLAAFEYDRKVIIEKAVNCREIECAVMGNSVPKASVLGEINSTHEFYSYEAKYIDSHGAETKIPADIDEKISEEIRECAELAYEALNLEGLSRVDFFLDKESGEFYLNEVNTLPGFTSISMYPKLWEKTGINYSSLLDMLIDFAIERHRIKSALKVDFS